MKLPAFDYACPATLAEAVALLGSRDEAKALAGGQSLVPMMAFRIASPSLLVDLRKLADLRQITIDASGVRRRAAGDPRRRFLHRAAHHGARGGRNHYRNPPAGVAGPTALGFS